MAARSKPERPPSGEVSVWWADRSLAARVDDAILSPSERRRVGSLRAAADRERSVLARVILRLALAGVVRDPAELIAIDWEHGPNLPTSMATWASVSHSDDRVGVAISTAGPVGLDVEAQRRTQDLVPAVREAVFTPDERQQLGAVSAQEHGLAALRLWTLKEAVLKATGDGLVRAPSTLDVAAVTGAATLVRFDGREDLLASTQLFRLDPGAAYVGSLALLSAAPCEVVQRSASDLLVAPR